MSDIAFKSIMLPGLPNRYTFTQIDNTLEESGKAADAKKTGDEISQIKAYLADVPNRAVKSAEQLISDKRTTDKVPYKYRASASGKSDRAYDCIVGGTVCFNQLIDTTKASAVSGGSANLSFSKLDNGFRVTASADISDTETYNQRFGLDFSEEMLSGHKYLLLCSLRGNITTITSCRFYLFNGVLDSGYKVYSNGVFDAVVSASSDSGNNVTSRLYLRSVTATSGQYIDVTNIMLFDLTAMFGTAIADHIYSLEQATAGAGVVLFRKMFPNDYYAYNAGSLVSVAGLSAHIMRDADNNIIGSYPLDSSLTLRGVPVLKDGKIEFDGDMYEADGTVTRRYGIVDLGTLTWAVGTDCAKATLTNLKPPATSASLANCISENAYVQKPSTSTLSSGEYALVSGNTNNLIFHYSGVTPTGLFIYELATPTTEEATPYTNPQVVDGYGTEEYVSTSVCPVGHVTQYPDNLRAKIDGLPWDLSMIAPVETAYKATRNYTTGQLLIVDNTLYKVTANIANNGTITPNSNVTATTLSEIISALAS